VSTARYNIADVAWRFFGSVERGVDVDGADFASFRIYFDDDLRRSVVKPAFRAEGRAIARYAERLHSAPGDTLLKRMLIADLQHYLPSDMLVKTDRASMRHGLEVRVPFLAPSFVDFALSLPSTLLLSPTGTTKVVLRDHVQQRVSARIAHGKKRGFNTPVGAALKGPLGAFARDTFNSEALRDTGPFDVDALLGLLTSHERGERDLGYPLYVALVAALWWKRFAL
jgi:asparagine synthase (glutamine-hydrolysing)